MSNSVSLRALDLPFKKPAWGQWLVNIMTVVLCMMWVIPIVWTIVVSFRPPDDTLGRGDVWFSDTITTESYQTAVDLAPFFPSIDEEGQFTN